VNVFVKNFLQQHKSLSHHCLKIQTWSYMLLLTISSFRVPGSQEVPPSLAHKFTATNFTVINMNTVHNVMSKTLQENRGLNHK
jgi:hypothetical protein